MSREVTREILTNARAYVAFWMDRAGYEVTHRGVVQERGSNGKVMRLPIQSVLPLDYADDLRKWSETFHESAPDPKDDPANWLPPEDEKKELIDPETGKVFVEKRGPGRPRKGWKYIGPKGKPGRQPAHGIKALSEALLLHAFTEHVHNAMMMERERFVQNLVCEEENMEQMEKFVTALLPPNSPHEVHKMTSAVLSHWVWMVKKKMLGENPVWHIMPIAFGKQGSGKSTAIASFLSPIQDYVIEAGVDQMVDTRFARSLAENLVVFCDELSGIKNADLNTLKALITANTKDYRPLGTNDVLKIQQACSFIAATNKSIQEQIKDETGNRRYFQINCADKLDWDLLASTDMLELWRGVDERRDRGYLEAVLDLITAKQAAERVISPAEEFLQERWKISTTAGASFPVVWERIAVYESYKEWCEKRGFRATNEREFRADCLRAGYELKEGKYEREK